MVRALELKSKDPGFDPQVGQVRLFLRVNFCADLFVPDPYFACTACTKICGHVKDPIFICCKRVGLTDSGMETRKLYTREKTTPNEQKKQGRACTMAVHFPQRKQAKFYVHCIETKDSYLI